MIKITSNIDQVIAQLKDMADNPMQHFAIPHFKEEALKVTCPEHGEHPVVSDQPLAKDKFQVTFCCDKLKDMFLNLK